MAYEDSKGLINCLCRLFATFGITDELACDGGSEFVATTTSTFLINCGVSHYLSSVTFPHSNCRAEIGVKTAKRMITSNTGPHCNLDTDTLQRAMLQYQNTPDSQIGSPAMCLFGRPIKDFVPILPGRYEPHPTWIDILNKRGKMPSGTVIYELQNDGHNIPSNCHHFVLVTMYLSKIKLDPTH